MPDKTFSMSMFASKADLYEAKCLYLEKRLELLRNVAVAADQVYDEFSLAHEPSEAFAELGEALDKAKLEI